MKALRVALALATSVVSVGAHAEWWEAKSDHFVVVSEGTKAETAKFAETLERFDNALRVLQNMPVGVPLPDAHKVTVYRFGETSDIGELAGGGGVAGFYIPRAARPVAFTPARADRVLGVGNERSIDRNELTPMVVLFHEYTHHFMLRNFNAAYPGWYVEGFAEVNSTIQLQDDGSFVVGRPANHRGRELFQMQQTPLRKLLDPTNRVDTIQEVLSRYSMGWLLIHYLTFGKQRDGQLAQYLAAVGKGETSVAAAERVFGDLGKLEAELNKYKSSNLPGMVVRPANYKVPTVSMRQLTAEEEKGIHNTILLQRGVTRKKAKSMESGLTSAAIANPANYTAQILAAEAALDARQFANASGSAERALALRPDSVDALVFSARALIENPAGDKERFAKARTLLAKAHTLDPADPRPLIETYQAWRKQGDAIPEDAIILLEQAFPMAAQDSTYRLTMARQLVEEKKYDLAINVIAPLAYSYDGEDPKKDVPSLVLTALHEGKYDEALAKLNKELSKRDGTSDDEDGE